MVCKVCKLVWRVWFARCRRRVRFVNGVGCIGLV
jgi:hypothetical protein